MASLHVVAGSDRGSYYPLTGGRVVVGRGEGCDIQLRDRMISRRHMEVRCDPEGSGFSVSDLASANGVYVNGVRISGDTDLHHNDMLLVGETRLMFSVQSEEDIGTVGE